jgi:hypothetical protein
MGKNALKSRQRVVSTLPPLLPRPQRLITRSGRFQLGEDTPILLPAGNEAVSRELRLAAESARDEIAARTGCTLAIERRARESTSGNAIQLRLDGRAAPLPRRPTARDAYRLRVRSSAIEITAPSPAGLRHGLQTLTQLTSASGRVPALDVEDQPDFRDRALMLDVSRGKVPTRETLEGLVDLCSRLRINVLMLYVEHTFAFRNHPEIGAGVSPLEAETLLAIDAYAADRGVELVPCLQSLGHMEHLLSLQRYSDLAESDRRWSISPSRPEAYRLLEDLYDEFLPLFRSKRFNANCDEPFDLGRGQSERIQPQKPPGRLFTDHVARLEQLARKHDKQLMIWADFPIAHPDQLERIDREVVLMDWWYEAEFEFNRIGRLRRRGFEVWACPGTSSWNALFPRVETSLTNVSKWADAGRRHGATGLLLTDWGDFGHYNALGVSFYAYAWAAQQAWSGEVSVGDFDRAFTRRVDGASGGQLGRLYRRLGAITDPGFSVANGSPLQYLYFDGLDRSFFLQHARLQALESCGRKLERAEHEVEALELASAGDDFLGLARQEVDWSSQALRLAIDKAETAIEYNAWRSDPALHAARDRRRLARRLTEIADRQRTQLEELERLWLARNEFSEFEKTRRRVRRSIASLRRGARRLNENHPPKPPKASELTLLNVFNEIREQFGMARR